MWARASCVSFATLVLFACEPKQMVDGANGTGPSVVPPTLLASRDQVESWVKSRNSELSHLKYLESRGVVEFRWHDAEGDHFEQVDVDLFLALPDRSAMRLSKLGEKYFWAGGDDERWWVFDLHAKPSRVEVFRTEDGPSRGGFGLLEPACIRALAALEVVTEPYAITAQAEVQWKHGSVLRTMRFADTGLPEAVTLTDEHGALVASSTLKDYVRVSVDGTAIGAWPRVPLRTSATTPEGSAVKLAFDEPSGRASRMKPALFDLDTLLKSLHPDEVILRSKPNANTGPQP